MIKLSLDDRDIAKFAKRFSKFQKDMPKHIRESVHHAVDEGHPLAAQMIQARYNISGVEGRLVKEKTGDGGTIRGTGGMLTVDQFDPVSEGNEVSVEIIRGNRKVIGPASRGPGVSGAFRAKGRIMERRQDEKYPIYPVWTIGIPSMLYYKGISDPLRDKMAQIAMDRLTERIMSI